MILAENTKTETNCQIIGNKFSIKESSVAFDILSTRLYSNPILAVIRELITNAYDSHLAAKQEKPIEITLPSRLDKVFQIKDYGTGMSKEDVQELYTSFFTSTKSKSNDYTGCFGLGSKTPFSFSNSFLVESRYGGKSYKFICVKKDGMPEIVLLDESDAQDTGMTITVNVDDYLKFHKYFYEYVQLIPELKLMVNGELYKHNVLLEGKNFIIINDERSIFYAKHGQNAFLLEKNQFDNLYIGKMMVLKFDIGELSITPNREQLADCDSNMERIASRYKDAVKELKSIAHQGYDEDLIGIYYFNEKYAQMANDVIGTKLIKSFRSDFVDMYNLTPLKRNGRHTYNIPRKDNLVIVNCPPSMTSKVERSIENSLVLNKNMPREEKMAMRNINKLSILGIGVKFNYKSYNSIRSSLKKKQKDSTPTKMIVDYYDYKAYTPSVVDLIYRVEKIEVKSFESTTDNRFNTLLFTGERENDMEVLRLLFRMKNNDGLFARMYIKDKYEFDINDRPLRFIRIGKKYVNMFPSFQVFNFEEFYADIAKMDWKFVPYSITHVDKKTVEKNINKLDEKRKRIITNTALYKIWNIYADYVNRWCINYVDLDGVTFKTFCVRMSEHMDKETLNRKIRKRIDISHRTLKRVEKLTEKFITGIQYSKNYTMKAFVEG